MRKLTDGDVTFSVELLGEDLPLRGNVMASGDDDLDATAEREVLEEYDRNPYAWTCVKVTATWEGIKGHDHLGGVSILEKYCSNPQEVFEQDYLPDMQYEALHNLNNQVSLLGSKLGALDD